MKAHLQALIARHAPQCDYLEVRIEEAEASSIAFRGRKLETLRVSQGKGGCVRAIVRGGLGFTSFNNIDRLDEFIALAIKQATLTGRGETKLAPTVPVVATILPVIKTDPRQVPLAKKIEILDGYSRLIMEADPEYIPTCSVGYSDSYRTVRLATSEGTFLHQEKMDLGCNLVPLAVRNGQTQMASAGIGSSNDFNVLQGLDTEVRRACQTAAALLTAPPIKGGTYTVVANPEMAGVFIHEAFGHTSEGEKVYENARLQEIMKLGAQFGSPILNVYDTGLVQGSRGQIFYDDEGVPAEKTYLIRNGLLAGRLHSRETAGKMGEAATGNGRAVGYKHPPIPRMRVTCIENGETPFTDMIKDIELGVYACDAFGGQGGEMFTFTAGRGYMIRNGKIEEMVKDVTLSGNLFKTLKNIDAVGNDFFIHETGGGCGKGSQFPLPVAHGSPHIRIRDVVVGGK